MLTAVPDPDEQAPHDAGGARAHPHLGSDHRPDDASGLDDGGETPTLDPHHVTTATLGFAAGRGGPGCDGECCNHHSHSHPTADQTRTTLFMHCASDAFLNDAPRRCRPDFRNVTV